MGRQLTRQQKWRKKHPKRYLAHLAVENAIRLGVIERKPCEVCGETRTDAHHDDYEKPYEVRFLCRRHHKLHHSNGGE
ncbi:hypothetical protein [Salibaculum halophilum]|uniref:hypothetical protein n=1 Tax=Salibaculum halophilum TaxID=1914408 RepID=UPI000A0FBAF7|nr:hypothetical protein [Salibaculum halophilum]